MIINEMNLSIRDLVAQYNEDDATGRVSAMSGRLDVRPEYQREFVYDEKQQSSVINTVMNQFPLNIMYFVRRPDDTYEVLDGQQRIISICRYITNSAISARIPAATGGFNMVNFNNLDAAAKEAFLDYPLRVYICEVADKEKLDWFQIINIAGEILEPQEIRNALYHGPWLTNAKSALSRRNCTAHRKYGKYMGGDYIRQKYLETTFAWKAEEEGYTGKDAIIQFMQAHQNDLNADELWNYFETVFDWVQKVFGAGVDKSMKGVPWGHLYNAHKDDNLDPSFLQAEVKRLLTDSEVQKKSGIYTCSPARRSTSTSDSSIVMSLCPPITLRVASAPSAGRLRTSRICTPTILSRGARAERRCGRIARCSARLAILRSRTIDWLRAQDGGTSVLGFFLL